MCLLLMFLWRYVSLRSRKACAKQNRPNTRYFAVTCISECMHPPLGRFHLDPTFYGRIAGGVRGTLLVNSLYIHRYWYSWSSKYVSADRSSHSGQTDSLAKSLTKEGPSVPRLSSTKGGVIYIFEYLRLLMTTVFNDLGKILPS